MTTIYLVRHAHSTYTPDELGRGLTEKGIQDAERMTAVLAKEDIDLVLSSPYQRAIDTVRGVALKKSLNIELDERFRERHLAGSPVTDFEAAVKAVWDDPDFSHPGGESNNLAKQRGIEGITEVLKKHHDKEAIVIGTHGNLMALIMQFYDPRYNYYFWKSELKMPDIYGLKFKNGQCVSIFHVPF
jgi:2,3-bisphosphoglycerate-dependent phosphoglycerate mutase